MPDLVCQQCGRLVDAHNRHVRFRLPDPVATTSDEDQVPGTWMSHEGAVASVMMQVPGVGAFMRCLLPVHLSGGYTVTYGVWLAVTPDDLQRAFRVWWQPEYSKLVVQGWLANALPAWGLLTAPAEARVHDVEQTPYIASSTDTALQRVLTERWPHDDVLASLPD